MDRYLFSKRGPSAGESRDGSECHVGCTCRSGGNEGNGIPQKILNPNAETHNFEADSGKPGKVYKDALLEDGALDANHVLGMVEVFIVNGILNNGL